MKQFKVRLCTAFCLAVFSFFATGLSAEEKAKPKTLPVIPNIHNTGYQCSECHLREAIEGIDNAKTVVLTDSIIDLCNRCHEGDNLHPVGQDPLLSKISVKIPPYFPLGTKGSEMGITVCTTCHLIHADDARDKLLRGFPTTTKKGMELKGPVFKNRREMCMSCHAREFIEKSPHSREVTGNCVYCHTADPAKATDVTTTYAKDIIRTCTFCHDKIKEEHYKKNNPFSDEDLKDDIKSSKLFMVDGKRVCTTCHNPHGESNNPHFLVDEYIKIAEKSRYINPHWQGTFCLSCHERVPEEGKGQPMIKFNGDINRTCMWCHKTNPTAVADIHPVGIIPQITENLIMPNKFPMQDGKLTCSTCHDSRKQEKTDPVERKENRLFLRGIPFTVGNKRSQVCFQCHIQHQFTMLNAHDQIDDQGKLVEGSCKYCHTSTPDRDAEGLVKMDPKLQDFAALCFRCHSDGPHPGKVNHIVKPDDLKLARKLEYEKKHEVSYPLDRNNKIFCATCHNPHEHGVIKNLRAAKGADTNTRARRPIVTGDLCFTCHDKDKASIQQFIKAQ